MELMKKIGLTGGFGSGKSTVGRMLEDLGAARIDADILTHEVTRPDGPAWRQIVTEFGEDVLLPEGLLDRKRLAAIVFRDAAKRKRLEAIVHPHVLKGIYLRLEELKVQGYWKAAILEIPLLFEVGWDKTVKLDAILLVTCDPAKQLERAKKKFALTDEEINLRISAQMTLKEKEKRATHVIENNGNLASARRQVERIWREIVG